MIRSDNSGLQALRARAYALAESGQFANAHAVEQALVAEGWIRRKRQVFPSTLTAARRAGA